MFALTFNLPLRREGDRGVPTVEGETAKIIQ